MQLIQFHHQRVDPQPQFKVEHDRAVFDQQVLIALPPVARRRAISRSGNGMDDRASEFRCRWGWLPAQFARDHRVLFGQRRRGARFADRQEPQGIARRELTDFPQIGRDGHERLRAAVHRRTQ